MRPRILVAAGSVLAFMSGVMASGIYSATTRAFNPPEGKAITPERNVQSLAVVNRTHLVQLVRPKTTRNK